MKRASSGAVPTEGRAAVDQDQRPAEPALAEVIDRNILTIAALRQQAVRERGLQDRLADGITAFSGRMLFIYLHAVWFGGWVLLNTGKLGLEPFDPFPYGLLTMIVSLEAIVLTGFVLISQNRLAQESERRADLDLHIGLLAEHELTRALQMLDAIHHKLGIEADQDHELAELERETRPEDVLAEIQRVQDRARKEG
jgi:uncharacterized membrane protein